MSPRTGRPIVGEEPKNKRISLRATETTVKKISRMLGYYKQNTNGLVGRDG